MKNICNLSVQALSNLQRQSLSNLQNDFSNKTRH